MFNHLYDRRGAVISDYDCFKTNRNLALFDLLITTGIRVGEANSIKISDIDFINRTIIIHRKGRTNRLHSKQ